MASRREPTLLYSISNIHVYDLEVVPDPADPSGKNLVQERRALDNGNAQQLNLMMVPTTAPLSTPGQQPEEDFYLHLLLPALDLALPASTQIYHKAPSSYLIPRWDKGPGSGFLELQFPPVGKGCSQEDIDTFETILAQCTAFLERARPPIGPDIKRYDPSAFKSGEGYVKGTGNHAGQIVLVDEENGSVVGELAEDAEIVEDPRIQHGSKAPVEVTFSQDGRKVFIEPLSEEVFALAEHPAYKNSTLVQNAAAASRLIISSSAFISNRLSSGADSFTRSVKPNAKPMTFSPTTHERVRKIHSFTSGVAGLSGKTVGQASKIAQNIGATLTKRGERKGANVDKEGFKPGLLNKSMIAFTTIADGIAYSGKSLIASGVGAASTVVGHKFGPEAGNVTASLAGNFQNAALVYIDVTGVSRKAVIKSVAKGMVVGRSKDKTVIVGGGDGGDVPPEILEQAQQQQHQHPGYGVPSGSGVRNENMGTGQVRSGASTPSAAAPSIVGFGNATVQGYNSGVGENIAGSSLQGQDVKKQQYY